MRVCVCALILLTFGCGAEETTPPELAAMQAQMSPEMLAAWQEQETRIAKFRADRADKVNNGGCYPPFCWADQDGPIWECAHFAPSQYRTCDRETPGDLYCYMYEFNQMVMPPASGVARFWIPPPFLRGQDPGVCFELDTYVWPSRLAGVGWLGQFLGPDRLGYSVDNPEAIMARSAWNVVSVGYKDSQWNGQPTNVVGPNQAAWLTLSNQVSSVVGSSQ